MSQPSSPMTIAALAAEMGMSDVAVRKARQRMNLGYRICQSRVWFLSPRDVATLKRCLPGKPGPKPKKT